MADEKVKKEKKKKKKKTAAKAKRKSRTCQRVAVGKEEGSAGKQVMADGWACQWFTWQGQLATDTSAI